MENPKVTRVIDHTGGDTFIIEGETKFPLVYFEGFSSKCIKEGVRLISLVGGLVLAEKGVGEEASWTVTTFDEWRD